MVSRPSYLSIESDNEHVFTYILSIYPDVCFSYYDAKAKGDTKKLTQAREDDTWRYDELPSEVRSRSKEGGMTKDELERLVRWKITHQTFRPFLLPQIRKNDRKIVDNCTAEARNILRSTETSSKAIGIAAYSRDKIRKALNKVCELTGVGPATGTLILSVFDDKNIPFFEDELYMWLFPESASKLKYNVKEYFDILDKFSKVNAKRIEAGWTSITTAKCYEKIAFVCEHWNYVDDHHKHEIERLAGNNLDQLRVDALDASRPEIEILETEKKPRTLPKPEDIVTKRKASRTEVQTSNPRRSKRIKK